MNREQAKELIRDTFESPFGKEKFVVFIRDFLNRIDETKAFHARGCVKQAFKRVSKVIKTYERIGTYTDPSGKKIDILIVYLEKDDSLERARTTMRNFAAKYLKDRGEKDAGLIAFVPPSKEDWRFSLVKMDYRFEETPSGRMKIKEEFTPARRWSFLVGKNEKSHTAQSRLVDILEDDEHNPNLKQLEDAFNIEPITKEFFDKYRDLLIRTVDALDEAVKRDEAVRKDFESKNINTVDFAKKLLGQIIFLYFLQKKGWFGVKRDAEWRTGAKDFLRRLFNKEYGDYKNFFNDILEPLFYEALARERDDNFYSRFNCKIPFLNGGLFEPIGGYDWVHTDILLPDDLFSNNRRTPEGDIGDGILDVFDRFNFTVKEDEPLEKEVAIDPELLGKLYEKFNAIRVDNFYEYKKALVSGKRSLEKQFNKKFGVYYTPREIVHYMCQQSLINYLYITVNQELLKQPAKTPKQLKLIGPEEPEQLRFRTEDEIIGEQNFEKLIKYGEQFAENEQIAQIKKEKIEKGEQKSTSYTSQLPESIKQYAKEIDSALKKIKVCDPAIGSGAFPVGIMHEIVKTRNVLSAFINGPKRSIYNFKRECIENSLYGVDIDAGACEVAKLRLWLSLIVDEEDIRKIKPLPNLDYKIVCGNSLLGVEKDLFNNELFNQLEKLKLLYFNETNPRKKQEYKNQIEELIGKITKGHKEFDFEVYFSEVFHEKGGFDVVIANPPYINVNQLKDKDIYRALYDTAFGSYDIYILFFEKSTQVLRPKGVLTFITSNKYFTTDYAKKLREFMIANLRIHILLDLADCRKVFENVLVSPAVIIVTKEKQRNYKMNLGLLQDEDVNIIGQINLSNITINDLVSKEGTFDIYSQGDVNNVLKNVEKNTIPLQDIAEVRTGIMGFEYWNIEPFIKEGSAKDHIRIITNSHIESFTFLFGKKINLYKKYFTNPYINLAKAPINENTKQFFKSQKIIVRGVAKRLSANIDTEGFALLVAVHGFVVRDGGLNSLYLLGLLNSNLFNWYHRIKLYSARIPKGSLKYPISFLKYLPIKKCPVIEQKPIINLVDKILSLTQSEDYLENPQKQAKVKEYECQINQRVYNLYDLTEDEIKIVEGGKRDKNVL